MANDYENKYPDKPNLDELLSKLKEYVDEELAKKQNIIDADHKLSADLILTDSLKQFVSDLEKYEWNYKQNLLVDNLNINTINNESLLTGANMDLATKVVFATAGNFAGLDASGNITDSGKKATDFATPNDLENKQDKNIVLYNEVVSTWVSDNTYTGYDYKAEITVNGITASDVAFVSFSGTDLLSGNYLGLCETSANTLTIYSKVNTSITIPNIVIIKNLRDLQQVQNVSVSGTDVTFDTIPDATSYEILIDGVSIGEVQA